MMDLESLQMPMLAAAVASVLANAAVPGAAPEVSLVPEPVRPVIDVDARADFEPPALRALRVDAEPALARTAKLEPVPRAPLSACLGCAG